MITDINELDTVVRSERFTLTPRKRRQGKIYFYARRSFNGVTKEVYITPATAVQKLSREQVLAKLAMLVEQEQKIA